MRVSIQQLQICGKNAVKGRTLEVEAYKASSPWCDGITGEEPVLDAKLWPLSTKEAFALDERIRARGYHYWLRSPGNTDTAAAFVMRTGDIITIGDHVTAKKVLIPAFRLDLSSIVYMTRFSSGKTTLNVKDPGKSIKLPNKKTVIATGKKLEVPYSIYGDNANDSSGVVILILDKAYSAGNANNATVLHNSNLTIPGSFQTDGTGTFDLPDDLDISKWGKDYKVYILASKEGTGGHASSVSEPYEITKDKVQNLKKVTVTFDNQGYGQQYSPKTVYEGQAIGKYSDPKAEGWVFKGWYKTADDHSAGNEFDFEQPVYEDMTVYAYWVKQHIVTFDYNGKPGTPPDPVKVADGEKVNKPWRTPTTENFQFLGWYDNADCTGDPYNFNTPVRSDLTLYVKWKDVTTYKVTFFSNGENAKVPDPQIVINDNPIGALKDPVSPRGLIFEGWYTDTGFSEDTKWDPLSTKVTQDTRLYAKWSDKLGLWVNGEQVSKTNLSGDKWSYDIDKHELTLDDIVFSQTNITEEEAEAKRDFSYASFVYATNMNITVKGKGTGGSDTPGNMKAGIVVDRGTLTIDADLTFTELETGLAASDVVIQGGKVSIVSSVNTFQNYYGESRSPHGIWGRTFYDYTDWNCADPYYTTSSVTITGGELNIEMKGKKDEFTPSAGVYGIEVGEIGNIVFSGGMITVKADGEGSYPIYGTISNSIYIFRPAGGKVGEGVPWFTDAFDEMATEVVLAEEELIMHAVSFDLNGKTGSVPVTQIIKEGLKAEQPENPQVEGWSFWGWYKKPECGEEDWYDFDTPVTEDVTLYAKFEKGLETADLSIQFATLAPDPYSGIYRNGTTNRYEMAYTGKPLIPDIIVTGIGGSPLSEGTDYTVTYSNNIKVDIKGNPAVVNVKGIGNYAGTNKKLVFYVTAAELNKLQDKELLTVPRQYVKAGSKPAVSIWYGAYKLTDKDLIYDKSAISETKTLDISGKGNFAGTLTAVQFKALDAAGVNTQTVKITTKPAKHVYNGQQQTLSIAAGELTVTDGTGKVLNDDKFDVTYQDNVNAGKATVIVKGRDTYYGSATATFTIAPCTTGTVEVGLASSGTVYYSPAGASPELKVTAKIDEVPFVLTEGVDYTVKYAKNKSVGNGSYTVKFKGNYKGTKAQKGSFPIEKAPFNVDVAAPDMTYKKPGKYYSSVIVTMDGSQLKEKKDYKVSYFADSACTSPLGSKFTLDGDSITFYAKVTGAGNYEATDKVVSYNLDKLTETRTVDLSSARIVDKNTGAALKSQTYTGSGLTPAVKAQIKEGKEWKDLDETLYKISFYNNINKGKAIVTVTPAGNKAAGSKRANFTIAVKKFDDFAVY